MRRSCSLRGERRCRRCPAPRADLDTSLPHTGEGTRRGRMGPLYTCTIPATAHTHAHTNTHRYRQSAAEDEIGHVACTRRPCQVAAVGCSVWPRRHRDAPSPQPPTHRGPVNHERTEHDARCYPHTDPSTYELPRRAGQASLATTAPVARDSTSRRPPAAARTWAPRTTNVVSDRCAAGGSLASKEVSHTCPALPPPPQRERASEGGRTHAHTAAGTRRGPTYRVARIGVDRHDARLNGREHQRGPPRCVIRRLFVHHHTAQSEWVPLHTARTGVGGLITLTATTSEAGRPSAPSRDTVHATSACAAGCKRDS
jgi:hypothetical protein